MPDPSRRSEPAPNESKGEGLPNGTVTFLLSDVEGSTAHWERDPETMRLALARHDALFEDLVRQHGGAHIRPSGEGDSRFAVFTSAPEAVAACREAGDRWGLAQALSQLASVFRQDGDLPTALTLREESAAIARQLGERWTLGMALMGAATVVRSQGDLSRATALYREALVVLRELEDLGLTPRAIDGLAGCAVLDADHLRAARLFGAAAALREVSGTREMSLWRVAFESGVADLQAAMGDLAFTTAWAEGRAMSHQEAVAYALDERDGD